MDKWRNCVRKAQTLEASELSRNFQGLGKAYLGEEAFSLLAIHTRMNKAFVLEKLGFVYI